MSIFIADANKLRSIAGVMKMVNHELEIKATPTDFVARAADVTHNFTVLVRPSGFRYGGTKAQACEFRVKIQELNRRLNSRVKHVCFYKVDVLSPHTPPELSRFVADLGIDPQQTCFFGYCVEDVLRDVTWPEDRAIEDHKFSVQIHPRDLRCLLDWTIELNFDRYFINELIAAGTVSIHITDWHVTLTAGENLRIRLQVLDTVDHSVSCRIKYDPTRGARCSAQPFHTYLPPGGIEQTIQLPSFTYKPLLRAIKLAESVFLHFSHNDDDMKVYVPPAFECVLADEGSDATFYFILPPTSNEQFM